MIEINLLPGPKKAKRSKGPALNMGAMFSGAASQVKDPFLIVAVAGIVLGAALTGWQWTMINGKRTALEELRTQVTADTTRYAGIMADRAAALAYRDTVIRQFTVIKTVDAERYTWPHVLSEISALLPQYTWLVSVKQTSTTNSIAAPPAPPPDTSSKKKKTPERMKRIDEIANAAVASFTKLKLQIVAQTVDIQAMTHYIRVLEASPFLENVTFVNSNEKPTAGKDVIEFTISAEFQTPAPSAIRTVPLTVSVK